MEAHVIDWEFCQFGHRSHDLGQMVACLYERHYFNNAEGALAMINQLLKAYGDVDEDFACNAAFRTGVYMLCWYTRRAPDAAIPFPQARVEEWIGLGRDFVLRGLHRDRQGLSRTCLKPLFREI